MTFCLEWDQRYKENTHLGIWPWSDLVSYVMRHARPANTQFKVLEIGCGAGANIPFFQHLGVEYYAVEGSPTIVNTLWERYPDLRNNLTIGDFTRKIPFDGPFDLIVDRGSLTCNTTDAIRNALGILYDKLAPEGKYIGIDWFSVDHSDYQKAELEDPYTSRNLSEGHLANTGFVHFSDKPHLEDLFSKFQIEVMEHKVVTREVPADDFVLAVWNFVARKV